MSTLRNRPILACLLFTALMVLLPLAKSQADNIKIGVLANKGVDDAVKRWTLTAEYLQKKIPNHTFRIIPLNFAQVGPAVKNGEIDFLITNPAMYVEMEAYYGVSRIITLIDNGLTQFGGVIFCKADRRDIQKIADLRGKSFLAVAPDSLGGWLTEYGVLKQHGLNPFQDFASMGFAKNHKSVIKAVKNGKADAGAARTDSLERMAKDGSIKLSDFRIINEQHYRGFTQLISTPLYPEWPLAKLKNTPDKLAKEVALTLLTMPSDSPANQAAGIGGWTIPLDYQIVHDLMRELRVGPYKNYGLITWQQAVQQYWHWFLLVAIVLVLMGLGLAVIYRINRKLKSTNLQRERAEAELTKAHQENEMILNSVGEGLVGMDRQGLIKFINPAGAHLLGYQAGEIMGKNLHALIHHKKPDGAPYPQEECPMFATITQGAISQVADEVFWTKSGAPLPVEYMTTPIKKDDEVVGAVGVFRDITERVAMERLRLQNELILNSIGEGLFEINRHGEVIFINPAALKLTGYTAQELIGQNLHQMTHSRKADGSPYPEEECPIHATLLDGESRSILDDVFWAKNGDPLPVAYLTNPVEEDGQVVGVVGSFRDITWRKKAEADLKKAHRENELIVSSIGEALMQVGRNGEIVFVNSAAIKLSGYEAKELIGQNLHNLLFYKKADSSAYPVEESPMYATLQDGKSHFAPDDVLFTKNGTAIPVAFMTNPVEEDGQVVGVVGSFRDIAWRKKAEADLKKSNEYLEKVFDSSAEGIGIVDSKGLVRRWNKASEEIFGYTFKELEGQPAFDLYADKDALAKMLIQLRREDYIRNYDIPMKRKDGSTFPASLSIRVLRDDTGKSMGSVTVARDLTELKEREAKLRTANEQLQALVAETNQRNHNMTLLQEMSDVFQSCQTSGETYSAIAHFVPKFFPDYGGALYILNSAKDLFEMTAIWGDAATMELGFGQDECWSLRRSRAYLVADSKETMNCRHVSSPHPGSYICVPMMAQGEVMGIFHLRKTETEAPEQIKGLGQFATTVAEAMALALANLKLRETLRNQAIRDGLTGLFNRRYMEETLERELSRGKRQGNPMGVIMMDLDHFKEYNDTYGHNAGDDLLCALGQLIQEGVRREDVACRYGGEEFLLIMPGASLEVTLARATDLSQAVKQLHKTSTTLKPITISAGVAIFPDHGASGKEVIRAADAALYQAKEEGRDRVIVAAPGQGNKMLSN